jgi:hypothetical protein
LAKILKTKKMKEKNMPLELKPGLRIGVGRGKLVLSHKEVKEDGLEIWAINYHLHIDGPIRDVFYSSAQILREIARVEELERECKTRYEYGRRYFNRCNELDEQLTKSENLRDVANKTNKERIDELEMELRSEKMRCNQNIEYWKNGFDCLKLELKERDANLKQLNSIMDSFKDQMKIAFKIIDKLKFWNMVFSIISLMFFALWLSAMYF